MLMVLFTGLVFVFGFLEDAAGYAGYDTLSGCSFAAVLTAAPECIKVHLGIQHRYHSAFAMREVSGSLA